MVVNINLISELLREYRVTNGRTQNLASDCTVEEGQLQQLNKCKMFRDYFQ